MLYSSLAVCRYALSKGAAAFAIEIEEAADSIKVLQHSIQRRGDASSKEEEAIGNSILISDKIFLLSNAA